MSPDTNESVELDLGQLACMACLLEVTVPKPGNVHRGADFADATLYDFVVSAAAISPVFSRAPLRPLGETILDACRATKSVTPTNTNLGIVLLLAPLAKAPRMRSSDIADCLRTSDANDCLQVYEAIRMCEPGGLGQSDRFDVHQSAPDDLLAAMNEAADRDAIARQYSNGFTDILATIAPNLETNLQNGLNLIDAIIHTHLQCMADFPDSLIARKTDTRTAETSAALAAGVIDGGPPGSTAYNEKLAELDFWLRSDGNRRNPGTTADLVTAAIYVCLRRGSIALPFNFFPVSVVAS